MAQEVAYNAKVPTGIYSRKDVMKRQEARDCVLRSPREDMRLPRNRDELSSQLDTQTYMKKLGRDPQIREINEAQDTFKSMVTTLKTCNLKASTEKLHIGSWDNESEVPTRESGGLNLLVR